MADSGDSADHGNWLTRLHANYELFNRVKVFVHDLVQFGKDEGARQRLLQNPTAQFYLSSEYFTQAKIDMLLSFKGRDGSPLEQALRSIIDRKSRQGSNGICTSHDLAPILQNRYGIKKGFQVEPEYNKVYKKFTKEWKKQSGAKNLEPTKT